MLIVTVVSIQNWGDWTKASPRVYPGVASCESLADKITCDQIIATALYPENRWTCSKMLWCLLRKDGHAKMIILNSSTNINEVVTSVAIDGLLGKLQDPTWHLISYPKAPVSHHTAAVAVPECKPPK